MKSLLSRHVLGLALLLVMLGHAAGIYEIGAVRRLDAVIDDATIRLAAPPRTADRVVIVDIDEKSLAEVGRWPWGRHRMAELVSKLFDTGQVALVGFNIVFSEPDESSGLATLSRLARRELKDEPAFQAAFRQLRPRLDHDATFAEVLKGRPVILGYQLSSRPSDVSVGALPSPALPADRLAQSRPTHWISHAGNLPQLQDAAAGAGHFNPMLDADGLARRVPLLVEYGGDAYEALALAVVRGWLGRAEVTPKSSSGRGRIEWLEVAGPAGAVRVPVDEHLAALVPYRGPPGSRARVSAADVLADRVPPGLLDGRIALVGPTALGLSGMHATPVGAAVPGVEIHANLIAGMLDGSVKRLPADPRMTNVLLVVLVGFIVVFALPRLSPVRASQLALAVVVALAAIQQLAWHLADLVLPVAAAVTLLAIGFAIHMSWGYVAESRIRRQFATLFGQYVPPELVAEMAKDPESYSMEGRRTELTMLFSDIRGFTSIAEGMPPDRLTGLLNEYLGAMTETIRHRRGTLDKYIGDAIMAFWGAPVADRRHATNAVLCALEMQAELAKLNRRFAETGRPSLQTGIGINTGQVIVGDMGSPVRRAYTALGDPVNLASRLEGITKEYGVGIIVGERTKALAEEAFLFRELDRVRVKGRDDAVTIYEPVAAVEAATKAQREEVEAWHRVLAAYRERDWSRAEADLATLAAKWPRPLYRTFAERIAGCRAVPSGVEWDGVWVFENK